MANSFCHPDGLCLKDLLLKFLTSGCAVSLFATKLCIILKHIGRVGIKKCQVWVNIDFHCQCCLLSVACCLLIRSLFGVRSPSQTYDNDLTHAHSLLQPDAVPPCLNPLPQFPNKGNINHNKSPWMRSFVNQECTAQSLTTFLWNLSFRTSGKEQWYI